jgi:hypothetical protein
MNQGTEIIKNAKMTLCGGDGRQPQHSLFFLRVEGGAEALDAAPQVGARNFEALFEAIEGEQGLRGNL